MGSIQILIMLIFLSSFTYASIDLSDGYWETTFGCDTDGDPSNGNTEWHKYQDPLICDGISKKGAWTTEEGRYEEIIYDANYPSGKGGKGQRHWIGDGTNINSGSIRIIFDESKSEFWIRWYQRWEEGFTSDWHTFKNVWLEGDDGSRHIFRPSPGHTDLYATPGLEYFDGIGFGSDFYKDGISDGSWQLFEMHVNMEDDLWEVWINEEKKISTTIDFGNTKSIEHIILPSNVKEVSNGRDMYIDFDDIAISTEEYIGAIRKDQKSNNDFINISSRDISNKPIEPSQDQDDSKETKEGVSKEKGFFQRVLEYLANLF